MQQFSQQPLIPLESTTTNTATMASASATTMYPFTYTTFSNPSPVPFTKPTIMPTGMFSFGPVPSCSATASSASAQPSGAPMNLVQGSQAGCVVSNDGQVSNHAFWDLYDCCKARNISAIGKPLPCSAQCSVGSEQTWQDLGSCLSKRNSIVVCKPADNEIGAAASSAASSSKSAAASSATTSGAASSKGSSATSVVGSSSASSMDVTHATFSKAGVLVFALVAVSSAAGMFL